MTDLWKIADSSIRHPYNVQGEFENGREPGCYFCGQFGTTDHLLVTCPIAKVVWEVVSLCFHQRTWPVWILFSLIRRRVLYLYIKKKQEPRVQLQQITPPTHISCYISIHENSWKLFH
jgi:hypothetical protein